MVHQKRTPTAARRANGATRLFLCLLASDWVSIMSTLSITRQSRCESGHFFGRSPNSSNSNLFTLLLDALHFSSISGNSRGSPLFVVLFCRLPSGKLVLPRPPPRAAHHPTPAAPTWDS